MSQLRRLLRRGRPSARQGDFRTALERGEFVVTLEAVPAASPGGRGVDSLLKDAEELAADGRVHAMSLTDNPGGGHCHHAR